MFKFYFSLFVLSLHFLKGCTTSPHMPVDNKTSKATIQLYNYLFELREQGIMLGHQDALAYGHRWFGEVNRSDVHDVVQDYPAVVGWEIGNLELGHSRNLDSVGFDDMRKYIQQTHKRGGITTISWHGNNILTGGNSWDCKDSIVVQEILSQGKFHNDYLGWLDKLAAFFLSLKDDSGRLIPVVFRPYHENTGSWFWWGEKQCTPEDYKSLWRMTYRFFQGNSVNNLLYCYSTSDLRDSLHFLERYPGDDVVDIIGFDCYVDGDGKSDNLRYYTESMKRNIDIVTEQANNRGKLAVIGETGYEEIKTSDYFTKIIYPLVKDSRLSWILFWRNAYEVDKPHHYYLPFKEHSAEQDFKNFISKKDILMNKDILR
jgi:mannan endo-1,4-beta-mannosidase